MRVSSQVFLNVARRKTNMNTKKEIPLWFRDF